MDNRTFIDLLAVRTGMDKEKLSTLTAHLGSVISEAMVQEDSIMVPAFGTFEPKKKAERIVVHPLTGKKILVPPKLSVNFRPSSGMKQRLKDNN